MVPPGLCSFRYGFTISNCGTVRWSCQPGAAGVRRRTAAIPLSAPGGAGAAEAGVPVPTVEAAFGTKARLLKAVIDAAIAGDEAPVPMLERAWAARARAASDATGVAAEFAGTLTASAQRAAGLVLVALDAARLDPDIAEVAAQPTRQRGIMAAWLVDELTARSSLRHGISRDEAIDTVWLLMDPAVFTRLTGQRKWTATRFRAWFTDTVIRLLLDPGHARL